MTNSLRPHGSQRSPLPRPGRPRPSPPHRSAKKQRQAPAPAASAPAGPKPKQRDAFFDNAKYLAIVLVAMGHSWEPLTDGSRAAEALYMIVYTFHMPAFIIISGYFSRSFDMRPDRLRRLITGVAVPYVALRGRVHASSSAGPTTTRATRSACSTPGT